MKAFVGLFIALVACNTEVHAECNLQTPAKRVVSLAPDLTEILFAIGADKKIVGVLQGSDYPPAALTLPKVGSYSGIDLEKIISLQPDLIVTWGSAFSRQMNALASLHIPIYVSDPKQLSDIPKTMRQLGCLVGESQAASKAADDFSTQIAALSQQYSQRKPVRVFYQIGSYSLITINHASWINEVMTLCGGVNVFANATLAAPEVSWEAVVVANPQVIISDAADKDWKQRWQTWQDIEAVKTQHLYSVNADWLERAGPRLVLGAAEMCHFLDDARSSLFPGWIPEKITR